MGGSTSDDYDVRRTIVDPAKDAVVWDTDMQESREPLAKPSFTSSSSGDQTALYGNVTMTQAMLNLLPQVYLPSILFGMSIAAVLPIIPLYARALSHSDDIVGIVTASESVGKLFSDVLAGMFFSKYGCRTTMTIGMIGVSVSGLISVMSHHWIHLLFAQFVLGFFESFFLVARQSYMRSVLLSEHRGRATAAIGGIDLNAFAIGPILGGYLSQHYAITAPFWVSVVLPPLAIVFIVYFIPVHLDVRPDQTSSLSIMQTLSKFKHTYITAGTAISIMAIMRIARLFIVPLQGDDLHLTHAEIGQVVAIGFLLGGLMFLPVGYVMDTYGRKSTGAPAFLVLAIGILVLPMASDYYSLFFLSTISGIGNGFSSGLYMTLGSDLAPAAPDTGAFLGVWQLIYDAASSVGPLLVGYVTKATSLATASHLIGILGIFGTFWYMKNIKETLRKPAAGSSHA